MLLSGRGEPGAQASERALFAEVPTASVVRCSFFTQNFTEGPFLPGVLDGHLDLPVDPRMGEPFLDLDDLAEIVVIALSEGRYQSEVLELTGPEALTFPQIAQLVQREAGHPVAFQQISRTEYVDQAVAAGLPAELAGGLADLFTEVLDGRNVHTTATVERILGRAATTAEVTLRRAAGALASTQG